MSSVDGMSKFTIFLLILKFKFQSPGVDSHQEKLLSNEY